MQVVAESARATYLNISKLLDRLTEPEKAEVDKILATELPIWTPLEGPQREAYDSKADILFFGGAAGGSKTDLLIGLSLTKHNRSIIFRREGTQLLGITDRMAEILRTREGFNSQTHVWRIQNSNKQVEFGSCPNSGDESRYQGRPHDLVCFDELSNILESQFRFLCGWNRTTVKGQRCRIVCAGNPPTSSEGEWIIEFWGPWLDPQHPYPAKSGELRWYAMIDGKETPVDSGETFSHAGKLIKPLSRTFIPSRIIDNPFLMETDYEATLQALPEPLRSQMLDGSFTAGKEDNIFQTIPTGWIDAAMARWKPEGKTGQMDSVGVDVARGGLDKTVIATRYGKWYSHLMRYPGAETPDGAITAGLILSAAKDYAPIHVDVIGVGASVFDHLRDNDVHVVGINGAESSDTGILDRSGKLRFRNKRAQLYWKLREMLEPRYGDDIALPPDSKLKADLCAPRWKLSTSGILIESKDEIVKRLGRSPDDADAVVYCSVATGKRTNRTGKNWRDKVKQGSWRVG